MIEILKQSLWDQFGASIRMLENAIEMQPDDRWHADKLFFYNAYHCVVMLDCYLTIPPKDFAAQLPFKFASPEEIPPGVIGDMVPLRIYEKHELLSYLQYAKEKCRLLISKLTEKSIENERYVEEIDADDAMNYPIIEILFYNMRHVQHHAAQLNMLLRNSIDQSPGWVFRVDDK